MDHDHILTLLARQRRAFSLGETTLVSDRLALLRRLRRGIRQMEGEIAAALRKDLGKSFSEAFMTEIGPVYTELRHMLRFAPAHAIPREAPCTLGQFPARAQRIPSPYGTVLIIAPWNYPFLLALQPAIDAIAAGNTVVVKPSEEAPETSRVLIKLLSLCVPPELFAAVPGDREVSLFLLGQKFDYIFFTGGGDVGRLVMEQAARHLTPVTLELGGKSPCIVHKDADLRLAARRIVFGKFINCGQTCVAPDYLFVHEAVREKLISFLGAEITRQLGTVPLDNPDYGRIINRRHFDRLRGLMDRDKTILGGEIDPNRLQIAPTLMEGVDFTHPVMREEIFGPLLPILTYRTLGEAMAEIQKRPHPLALYLFSQSKSVQKIVMHGLQFGGGCINDTVMHVAGTLPFGGVGASGMGCYHGKAGFDTFTHYKSVLDKAPWPDPSLRYQPYSKQKERLLRLFLR